MLVGLQGTAVVALDKRFGGFKEDVNPEIEGFMKSTRNTVELIAPVVMDFPWHKISPALSPNYRKLHSSLDEFATFVKVRSTKSITTAFIIFLNLAIM